MQLRQPFLDHIDKLDWKELSSNPNAVLLLEQNLDKIDWTWLVFNSNAVHILEQNPEKIHWSFLCKIVNKYTQQYVLYGFPLQFFPSSTMQM